MLTTLLLKHSFTRDGKELILHRSLHRSILFNSDMIILLQMMTSQAARKQKEKMEKRKARKRRRKKKRKKKVLGIANLHILSV